jgi:general secretion pathway protein L
MGRMQLGLDIRTDHVCAVLANRDRKQRLSLKSISVPIAAADRPKEALAIALSEATDILDPGNAICRVGLPIEAFDFYSLSVPFADKKKIAKILPFELEPKITVLPEDVVIDFQTVKNAGNTDTTSLWAAMILKRALDDYLAALAAVDLKPDIVTFNGYSAVNRLMVAYDLPDQALALDIGQKNATCFFLVENQVALVRRFALKTAAENAEAVLLRQITYSMAAFAATWPDEFEAQGLFILGWPGDAERWEKSLAKDLAFPLKKVDLSDDPKTHLVRDEAVSWLPGQLNDALALAAFRPDSVRTINFDKNGLAKQTFLTNYKKELITTAVFVLLAMVVFVGSLVLSNNRRKNRIALLDREIETTFRAALPQVSKIVDPLAQMRNARKKALKVKATPWAETRTMRVIDILNTISRQIPDRLDLELGRVTIGPDGFVLSGHTGHFNVVNDIKKHLESTFSKVTIGSAKIEKATSRVAFKIRIDL